MDAKRQADRYDQLEEKRRAWVRSVDRVEALESKLDETTRKLAEARGTERVRMADLRVAAARARNRVES